MMKFTKKDYKLLDRVDHVDVDSHDRKSRAQQYIKIIPIKAIKMQEDFEIETLEGTMKGKKGDWLMQGVKGELYPCERKIFEKSYRRFYR